MRLTLRRRIAGMLNKLHATTRNASTSRSLFATKHGPPSPEIDVPMGSWESSRGIDLADFAVSGTAQTCWSHIGMIDSNGSRELADGERSMIRPDLPERAYRRGTSPRHRVTNRRSSALGASLGVGGIQNPFAGPDQGLPSDPPSRLLDLWSAYRRVEDSIKLNKISPPVTDAGVCEYLAGQICQ